VVYRIGTTELNDNTLTKRRKEMREKQLFKVV